MALHTRCPSGAMGLNRFFNSTVSARLSRPCSLTYDVAMPSVGNATGERAENAMKSHFTVRARKAAALLGASIVAATAFVVPIQQSSQAAERPFPSYELSYQRIVGQKDPNFNPETDEGDGCIHSANPELAPLPFFGFESAAINQCDGMRVKVRWFYDKSLDSETTAPTLEFRFGTTWQYTQVDNPDPDAYIWKPVENFLYDGQPTDIYKADDPVVKDSNGNFVRMHNGKGFYEPIHFVFEDTFGPGVEHTMQYDVYLPYNADWGGMTFGTGSTGDTHGGSIGAKANGMTVPIAAKMDVRYVLDSEYRAARGFPQASSSSSDESQSAGLPNEIAGKDEVLKNQYTARPQAGWGRQLEGSTYTTLDCLEAEGQQLTELANSVPINKIYPNLNSDAAVPLEAAPGTAFFARYPYQYYLTGGRTWDSLSGQRYMNLNSETGEFEPFTDKNGNQLVFPYKPTPQSLIADIPGYKYVGFDLPTMKNGAYKGLTSEGYPEYQDGPNVASRYHKSNEKTQHFYYTYEKVKGAFNLSKVSTLDKTPIAGAEFELYQVIDPTVSACGVQPDLTDTSTVNICPLKNGAENTAPECSKTVRRITLDNMTDGKIITDAEGAYAAPQQSLASDTTYLLKEVAVPDPYRIDNAWTQFNVPLQTSDDQTVSTPTVIVKNPESVPPPEVPPTPPTKTPPTKIVLSNTGANAADLATACVALVAAGGMTLMLRRRSSK